MKCDGEKGNPSDVEGGGSISTDVARRTDGASAHGRRCACASATAGWLAPRHHRIAASCRGPRRALASWFRNLMGGERIALSGVETERCNLYFTSMFRPAGQLSLMQASGLWYCIGQVWTFFS